MKITIENYQDFKPSELVLSFKDHVEFMVERSRNAGSLVNMGSYTDTGGCLACLGGHAAMNIAGIKHMLWERIILYPSSIDFDVDFDVDFDTRVLRRIALLGDHIRHGSKMGIMMTLGELYPQFDKTMNEIANDFEGEMLPYAIIGFIDPLEKAGDLIANIDLMVGILEANGL